ncbi:MAG: regulatory protein RecX [Candidatus Berkelbacteria bacterium]|nr:regulatory protein RecX [Candidatus Berkelbacteria bacterium]
MKKTPLEYALNLLKVRERSEGEIKQKMLLRGYFLEEIETVLKWLKEKNFVDDKRFVQNYIDFQRRMGQAGKFKIKCRLKSFSISEELIDEELKVIDHDSELEMAENEATKWLSRKVGVINQKEKLARFLSGRGFGMDVIMAVINQKK